MSIDSYQTIVVLPYIQVQNANAISSPLTWGFPAPSAFTGFTHALERRVRDTGRDLRFRGTGIVCHRFEPQIAEGPIYAPKSFRLTRNPLDQSGATAAIVEEGRTHLTISLVVTVSGKNAPASESNATQLAKELMQYAEAMRIAGGSVLPVTEKQRRVPKGYVWDSYADKEKITPQLMRYLLPGFALVSRESLLIKHLSMMQQQQKTVTALDALLDLCRLHYAPGTEPDEDGKIEWPSPKRRKPGWLVPIAVGYGAISELYLPGKVKRARDLTVPFRFVESLLSLGEWISPHRLESIGQLIWQHHAQPEVGLYRLTQPQ